MNLDQEQARDLARHERAQQRCPGLIAWIIAEIETQKETAINRPEKATECRGAVLVLRRLLSQTDPASDSDAG